MNVNKRKTSLWLCMLLLMVNPFANAARRPFYGRLVTATGQGIPFGSITSPHSVVHFQANNDGFFYFDGDPVVMDTLVFSAPGYKAKDFVTDWLPDDSIIIELTKRKNILIEATVGAKGVHTKSETIGISRGGYQASCYLNIDDEIAVYLPLKAAKNGMITEIGAFITKEGVTTNDFKLHLYAPDSATGAPGEEITDSILIMQGDKGNEWVTADLSENYIQAHGGIFVSMEWIIGNRNDYYPRNIPNGTDNYYAGKDSLRTAYNGQVLGLSWQTECPKVYRRYSNNIHENKDVGKWYLTPPLRGGHSRRGWIAPMLYATYTYVDK